MNTHKKPILIGLQSLCFYCEDKRPPSIRRSDYLVLYRDSPYSLMSDGLTIDKSRVGVCKECLTDRFRFQIDYKIPFDVEYPYLIYKEQ